jgi:small conductance mechanosensitive channel
MNISLRKRYCYVVRPWVNAADYWKVYFEMTAKIKLALDENDITIPFPQRDVHIKNQN